MGKRAKVKKTPGRRVFFGPITIEEIELRRKLGLFVDGKTIDNTLDIAENSWDKENDSFDISEDVNLTDGASVGRRGGKCPKNINLSNFETRRMTRASRFKVDSKMDKVQNLEAQRSTHLRQLDPTNNSFLDDFNLSDTKVSLGNSFLNDLEDSKISTKSVERSFLHNINLTQFSSTSKESSKYDRNFTQSPNTSQLIKDLEMSETTQDFSEELSLTVDEDSFVNQPMIKAKYNTKTTDFKLEDSSSKGGKRKSRLSANSLANKSAGKLPSLDASLNTSISPNSQKDLNTASVGKTRSNRSKINSVKFENDSFTPDLSNVTIRSSDSFNFDELSFDLLNKDSTDFKLGDSSPKRGRRKSSNKSTGKLPSLDASLNTSISPNSQKDLKIENVSKADKSVGAMSSKRKSKAQKSLGETLLRKLTLNKMEQSNNQAENTLFDNTTNSLDSFELAVEFTNQDLNPTLEESLNTTKLTRGSSKTPNKTLSESQKSFKSENSHDVTMRQSFNDDANLSKDCAQTPLSRSLRSTKGKKSAAKLQSKNSSNSSSTDNFVTPEVSFAQKSAQKRNLFANRSLDAKKTFKRNLRANKTLNESFLKKLKNDQMKNALTLSSWVQEQDVRLIKVQSESDFRLEVSNSLTFNFNEPDSPMEHKTDQDLNSTANRSLNIASEIQQNAVISEEEDFDEELEDWRDVTLSEENDSPPNSFFNQTNDFQLQTPVKPVCSPVKRTRAKSLKGPVKTTVFKRNSRANKTLSESLLKSLASENNLEKVVSPRNFSLRNKANESRGTKQLNLSTEDSDIIGGKNDSKRWQSTEESKVECVTVDNLESPSKNVQRSTVDMSQTKSENFATGISIAPQSSTKKNKFFSNPTQAGSNLPRNQVKESIGHLARLQSEGEFESSKTTSSQSPKEKASTIDQNKTPIPLKSKIPMLSKPKFSVSGVSVDTSWTKKLNLKKVMKTKRPTYMYSPSRFGKKPQ